MNNGFPSKKMRDYELAHTFCFWKPYKHTRKMAKVLYFETIPHFYWKKDKGLSLQIVFSPFCGDFVNSVMRSDVNPDVFVSEVFQLYTRRTSSFQ